MVEFNTAHKDEVPRITSNYGGTVIEWFTPEGEWGKVDIKDMSTSDIWILRASLQDFMREQLRVIDDELNNWTAIYCSVCGEEDLAHRGYPFITWGIRANRVLCPRHLRAFDTMGTPEGEMLKKLKAERKEIKELFG